MGNRAMRGFTLVELIVVVMIIAILALIALPNLLSARMRSNEMTAISTLRALVAAQSQFQARTRADLDGDGLGEAGTLGEMSAGVGVRGGAVLSPAVLSSSFRSINANGEAAKHGYQYKVFLPGAGGVGLGELAGGGPPAGIDTDLAEIVWCAYAWPTNYEQTGARTFFVNQVGDLIFTVNQNYSGPGAPIAAGAAFLTPGSNTSITGLVATTGTGRDGGFWLPVQS